MLKRLSRFAAKNVSSTEKPRVMRNIKELLVKTKKEDDMGVVQNPNWYTNLEKQIASKIEKERLLKMQEEAELLKRKERNRSNLVFVVPRAVEQKSQNHDPKLVSAVRNLHSVKDFLEFILPVKSVEVFSIVVERIVKQKFSYAELNEIEKHFYYQLRDFWSVDFMNQILSMYNSWPNHQRNLLLHYRNHKIIPNEETFKILIEKARFSNSEETIEGIEWMMEKVKFKPSSGCFEIASNLKFDTRELTRFFLKLGLDFPLDAIRSFIYESKSDKISLINGFKEKFNLKLDARVMLWYVRACLKESPEKDALQLLIDFEAKFNIKVNDLILRSLIDVYIEREELKEFCNLCLLFADRLEVDDTFVTRLFQVSFLKGAPDRDIKLFLSKFNMEISVSDALACVSNNFSSDFLALFKRQKMSSYDLCYLCMCFFCDISDFEQCKSKFQNLSKEFLVENLRKTSQHKNYVQYWKMLQALNVKPYQAAIFLSRVFVKAPPKILASVISNTKDEYKEVVNRFKKS